MISEASDDTVEVDTTSEVDYVDFPAASEEPLETIEEPVEQKDEQTVEPIFINDDTKTTHKITLIKSCVSKLQEENEMDSAFLF